jgi:hypothetical protein
MVLLNLGDEAISVALNVTEADGNGSWMDLLMNHYSVSTSKTLIYVYEHFTGPCI